MTRATLDEVPAVPPLPDSRRLPLLALISVAFFTTCAGAFGIEPLVGAVGPGWAVALLFLTPALWSVPIAMMVAELSTLMPEEGGYYIWVREALGPFWAVQEAWWTMGASIMLMAIFPVVAASYFGYLVPQFGAAMADPGMGPIVRWLAALAVIGLAMAVNWFGARDVGWSANASIAFVLGAFALLIVVWLAKGGSFAASLGIVSRDLATPHKGALLLGLSVVILNYGGYDNIATYAAEVDRPRRNYPIALIVVVALAVLSYALPVLAGISVTTDAATWTTESGWPVLGGLIGGRWLGMLLAAAGLVSMWAAFNAQVLYTSRIPFVMARDGWLSRSLSRADAETAAPRAAILIICAITALCCALTFGSLVIIMTLLYTASLVLEFLALLAFRLRRPLAPRPFRIPGGRWGLAYVCLAPLGVSAAVLTAAVRDGDAYGPQLLVVGFVIASGLTLYGLRRGGVRAYRAAAPDTAP